MVRRFSNEGSCEVGSSGLRVYVILDGVCVEEWTLVVVKMYIVE